MEADASSSSDSLPEDLNSGETRITMWNRKELRKVSGNAAPKHRNLEKYMRRHPDVEVYDGQDLRLTPEQRSQRPDPPRVPVYNRRDGRIYSGNAAPLEKNLAVYLKKHPDCEVYVPGTHHFACVAPVDLAATTVTQPVPTPMPPAVTPQVLAQPQNELVHMQSLEDPWPMSIDKLSSSPPKPGDLFLPADGLLQTQWEQQLYCAPSKETENKLNPGDFAYDGLENFIEQAFVPPVSCLHYIESCFHPGGMDMDLEY